MTQDDILSLIQLTDAILDMQARCTCATVDDIRDCPNYLPGDEELMEA